MTNLNSDEEIEMCHYRFEMPRHTFIFYGFWSVFIVTIVVISQNSTYSGPAIPWDNCDTNKSWEPVMRSYINKEQHRSEIRKIIKYREKNNLYRMNNYSRIEYGTSELSYCKSNGDVRCNWETKTAKVELPSGYIVKSITRTIELDPYFASGLRFIVLECMSFRMVLALFRCTDVLTSRKKPLPKFVQMALSSSIVFSFLQSLSLFWITALHSEFDRSTISFFHPYAYLFLGVSTFFEMLIDLFHDAVDGRFLFIQTPRFYIKIALFSAFSLCYPRVVLNWLSFYKLKKCHAYVPVLDGLFEYICAVSMIVFNFINAQIPVEMYITPTAEDVRDVSSFPKEVYNPVYHSEKTTVIYESLSDRK